MTPRVSVFVSVLITAALLLVAWCSIPEPRPLTEAPTRAPMVVTPYVFVTMTPLVPERPLTARDYLPMTPSTRQPTVTVTPTPTPESQNVTPTINTSPAVQRG